MSLVQRDGKDTQIPICSVRIFKFQVSGFKLQVSSFGTNLET